MVNDKGHQLVRISALDLNKARHELPGLISQSGLTLTRYELVMPNLEDIFLDIVKGREVK